MTVDITGNLTIKRSNDPIGFAFVIALAFHAFIILAVSFDISREKPPAPERTLDITLVQPKPDPKPAEDPDFLAQQSQQGGGEETIKERQTSPLGNPAATPTPRSENPIPTRRTPEGFLFLNGPIAPVYRRDGAAT